MADAKGSTLKPEEEEKATAKATNLPLARIRTIMKSSPDAENISTDAIVVVTKAAELFIQFMAREGIKSSKKQNFLDYKDLADVVDESEKLEFLSTIIPKKISVREYKEILENASDSEFDSMASSEDQDEEEEEDESGSGAGESEAGSVVEVSSGDEDQQ